MSFSCPRFPAVVLSACLIVGVLSSPRGAVAAPDDNAVVDLEPVVVSATRTEISGRVFAENVKVYTQEDLKKMAAHDLGDALQRIPGLAVSVGSGLGQPVALSMNGADSRDVLLMVDDIPFNTQLSGQASPSRLPIENIERIEIIKGAASSAWGSSLGGVINVITRKPGNTMIPKGSVTASAGAYGLRRDNVALAGKAGETGYYLMQSRSDVDGVWQGAFSREQKYFGKMVTPLGDRARVTGSFGFSGGNVQDGVLPTQRMNTMPYIARYGKVRMDLDTEGPALVAAYKYNDQDTITDTCNTVTGAALSGAINRNLYQGLSVSGSSTLREEDVLVVGSDVDWSTIKSSNYLSRSLDVVTGALYANYTWRTDGWDIVPAARFDENSRFGEQLSPALGAVHHWDTPWKPYWRGKVSEAFNAPPLMWAYNSDPAYMVAANADLRPERAWVYETGVGARLGSVDVDLGGYRNDIRDGLVTVYNSSLAAYQKQNIRRLRREGVDGTLGYQLTTHWHTFFAANYDHPVDLAAHHVVRGNGVILYGCRWGVDYHNEQGFGGSLSGRWDRWDASPGQSEDRKPVLDARVRKDWMLAHDRIGYGIYLNVYNITDARYWTDPDKPLARRYGEVGMVVSF